MPAKAAKRKKRKVYRELLDLSQIKQEKLSVYSELLNLSDDLDHCASSVKEHSRQLLSMVKYHGSGRVFGSPTGEEFDEITEALDDLLATAKTVTNKLKQVEQFRRLISKVKPPDDDLDDGYFIMDASE